MPPPLTAQMIAPSRVIARGRGIRDLQRLLDTYGGQTKRWIKKSSPVVSEDGHDVEYHWYEHAGLGRFEIKRKIKS
jgi:hypothetical protein